MPFDGNHILEALAAIYSPPLSEKKRLHLSASLRLPSLDEVSQRLAVALILSLKRFNSTVS